MSEGQERQDKECFQIEALLIKIRWIKKSQVLSLVMPLLHFLSVVLNDIMISDEVLGLDLSSKRFSLSQERRLTCSELCYCFLLERADGLVANADPTFSLVARSGEDLEEASLSLLAHPFDVIVDLKGLLRSPSGNGDDDIRHLPTLNDFLALVLLVDLAEHQAVFFAVQASLSEDVPHLCSTLLHFDPCDDLCQVVALTFHEVECWAVAQVGHPHENIATILEQGEVQLAHPLLTMECLVVELAAGAFPGSVNHDGDELLGHGKSLRSLQC